MGIGKPTKRAELPWSARDVLALSGLDAILHGAVVAFADVTGIWRYPIRCRGDFAEMRFLDHAYWIYKAGRPIRRARRGSGLEEFFARQSALRAELPSGFRGDRELTLSACGDLMSHTYLADSKDELYAAVSDLIFDADISTANLECVVDPPVEKELAISLHTAPSLYYDEHAFAAARGASKRFTFLAGACNHSLDFGEVGVDRTIRALDDAGIAFAGLTRRDDDPFRATIIERRGFRIGAVAYTFGLNAHEPPKGRPHIVHHTRLNDGVAAADLSQLTRQIQHARAEGVDFLVAHLHWGLEHELFPIPEQIELAHHLAELGVDAIFGHHPHVLQPMELYRTRRDPHRQVPIYYSLGNLINPFSAPDSCRSGVARITLAKGTLDGAKERVYVRAATLAPVTQVVDQARRKIRLVPSPAQP